MVVLQANRMNRLTSLPVLGSCPHYDARLRKGLVDSVLSMQRRSFASVIEDELPRPEQPKLKQKKELPTDTGLERGDDVLQVWRRTALHCRLPPCAHTDVPGGGSRFSGRLAGDALAALQSDDPVRSGRPSRRWFTCLRHAELSLLPLL